MQRKKHSREEIATKLSKADELHERGKTQAEIARTLGVSAMTYHRWRKARSQPGLNGTYAPDLPQSAVAELHKDCRVLAGQIGEQYTTYPAQRTASCCHDSHSRT